MRLGAWVTFILYAVLVAIGGLPPGALPWLGLLVWGGLIVVGYLSTRRPKPAGE